MKSVSRASSVALVLSVAVTTSAVAGEQANRDRTSVPRAAMAAAAASSGVASARLSKLSDAKLDALAARLDAAAVQPAGGGGHKKTLIIVGVAVVVVVLLVIAVRDACKKEGAECLK